MRIIKIMDKKTAVSLILLLASAVVAAQSSASASIAASIVTPQTLVKNNDLRFADQRVNDLAIYKTVSYDASAGLAATTIHLPIMLKSVLAASFTVKGELENYFDVNIPGDIVLRSTSGEEIEAVIFSANPANPILKNGELPLEINAALMFINQPLPGRYITKDFEVVVNFN